MGIEELVVKHRLERGEIAPAHRRIALVLEGEDFLVAAHRQTSLAVSPGTSGLQLAWRLLSLDHLVGAARAPAIRRTGDYGMWAEARPYCALMLAARITLAHFSVSSATSLPKSAGEPGSSVPPSSTSLVLSFGSSSAALISRLSLSMIAIGVALGAPTPNSEVAS